MFFGVFHLPQEMRADNPIETISKITLASVYPVCIHYLNIFKVAILEILLKGSYGHL
jgi:hypothetical protein